jgi:hypothetical protein
VQIDATRSIHDTKMKTQGESKPVALMDHDRHATAEKKPLTKPMESAMTTGAGSRCIQIARRNGKKSRRLLAFPRLAIVLC